MYHNLFKGKIQIIGVGGIFSGEDVFEHILAGASAVQVGSAYLKEGAGVFKRINEELDIFLGNKGYKNINEFKGKV